MIVERLSLPAPSPPRPTPRSPRGIAYEASDIWHDAVSLARLEACPRSCSRPSRPRAAWAAIAALPRTGHFVERAAWTDLRQ
jgi:hypothetical protein